LPRPGDAGAKSAFPSQTIDRPVMHSWPDEGRPMELQPAGERELIRASTRSHEGGGGTSLAVRTTARPIRLADIDRLLQDSAGVGHAGPDAPIRAWRDELTRALESLSYAETVLGGDVEILRHALVNRASDPNSLVRDLPRVLAARPWGDGWAAPEPDELGPPLREDWVDDWDVFTRSDLLMSAHQQMAYTDLASRPDVQRVLRSVLEQLANLALRREIMEARLQEIRAAIVQQYRDGQVSTRDWLS